MKWNSDTADVGGLSPRVRGNLSVVLASKMPVRSIPACAGEPLPFFEGVQL